MVHKYITETGYNLCPRQKWVSIRIAVREIRIPWLSLITSLFFFVFHLVVMSNVKVPCYVELLLYNRVGSVFFFSIFVCFGADVVQVKVGAPE